MFSLTFVNRDNSGCIVNSAETGGAQQGKWGNNEGGAVRSAYISFDETKLINL